MTAIESSMQISNETVARAIESATAIIAPAWPLDRLIAVNPYWGLIDKPFNEAAGVLASLAGSPMVMPVDYYRQAWKLGEIIEADLQRAIEENSAAITIRKLLTALEDEAFEPRPLPLLSDQIDRRRDLTTHPSWCDSITHQISQFCAAYFDSQQADWHPDQSESLYASWRRTIGKDYSIHLLMGESRVPERSRALAANPADQVRASLQALGIPKKDESCYLQALILRIGGWASWCAYLRWQKRLEGADDDSMIDLLAIRLAWETLLDDGKRQPGSAWSEWMSVWLSHDRSVAETKLEMHLVWQRAQEIGYQRQLVAALSIDGVTGSDDNDESPAVQAAFCIDVRSEVFRRHFEAQSDSIETLGFAGFFGLPISYAPLGTPAGRPQLPGLLAPQARITDSSGDQDLDARIAGRRQQRLAGMWHWQTFQSVPLSSFSLVESLGLGYLIKLARRTLRGAGARVEADGIGLKPGEKQRLRPNLNTEAGLSLEDRADLAAGILSAMGFGGCYARLVLLVGHGCQTANNPHQAGLECGACCGQTGEVNARALAGMLNDPEMRDLLRQKGKELPESTRFVAGFHNTTLDEVSLFDLKDLPASHREDISSLQGQLQDAAVMARSERAEALGLEQLRDQPKRLHRELLKRANDWAQTRPEWGLANNASFIVAPRNRTRGMDLQGRSFLHEYDHRMDEDGKLLEQIMTAPMIVAHWINMQYFASTVDNHRYGSGNKTLHNVVGGRIGVFEGNGGDLRIGLPWQSLNDGKQWQHAPLRLTVVIDAPADRIETVIKGHELVQQLVENQWLYLLRFSDGGIEAYRDGHWQVQ